MKITYELDLDNEDANDKFKNDLIHISFDMYSALTDISNELRSYRKGYLKEDQLEENISNYLVDSKIFDLE